MGIDYQCFDHKDNPDGDFLCPEYSRYYGRDRHWYLLLVQGTYLKPIYIESDTTLPIIGDVIFKFILGKGNSKHNQENTNPVCLRKRSDMYINTCIIY